MIALRWITVKQTAELLRVPQYRVREMLNSGESPGRRAVDTVGAVPWEVDAASLQNNLDAGWTARDGWPEKARER